MKLLLRFSPRQSLTWLVFACLLSACGGPDTSEEGLSVLNRSLASPPDSLDIHRATNTQAHNVQADLFEGLLGYSASGSLESGVATNWTVSDDGLTYTFTLRDNARWSNGDPVTAEDFVYSFRRLVAPDTAAFYADFLTTIVNARQVTGNEVEPQYLGVKAIDTYTLVISLTQPTPYFPQLLTHPATFPLHRESVEAHGDRFARAENLVSNGAYRLVSHVVGGRITLSRNTHYWDNDATSIDVVHYDTNTSPTDEYNRYRTGELDITSNVAPGQFQRIKERHPNELRVAPLLGLYYYGLNLTQPPFKDNPKLRKALSLVIDREILVQKVSGRGEIAAHSWVPPGVENYQRQELTFVDTPMEERIEEAKRLYREAGYSDANPLQFELRYNTADFEQRMALAIQSMWLEHLGAQATLVNEEFKVLISNIQGMQITQAFRLSWIGDYNDADTFLQLMMTDNPMNLTGYSNGEVDDLLERASRELSPDRRELLFRQAEREFLDDYAAIPLYYYVSKHLVSQRVKGWEDNILDRHPTKHLSVDPSP